VNWRTHGTAQEGTYHATVPPNSRTEEGEGYATFHHERNFAEQLEVNRDVATSVTRVNANVGVQWLFSFLLSADKKKTYCLYEAPNAEAIREAARRLNIPADVITEVDSELRPEQFA